MSRPTSPVTHIRVYVNHEDPKPQSSTWTCSNERHQTGRSFDVTFPPPAQLPKKKLISRLSGEFRITQNTNSSESPIIVSIDVSGLRGQWGVAALDIIIGLNMANNRAGGFGNKREHFFIAILFCSSSSFRLLTSERERAFHNADVWRRYPRMCRPGR